MTVRIKENVRRKIVYVIYGASDDVSQDVLELELLGDALKRAGAEEIVIVCPYLPGARSDRKICGREPIGAAMTIRRFQKMCHANRIICMDLHNDSIGGMGDCSPIDNIKTECLFAKYIRDMIVKKYHPNIQSDLRNNLILVAPDEGSAKRTSKFASMLNNMFNLSFGDKKNSIPDTTIEYVMIHKERDGAGKINRMVMDAADREKIGDKIVVIIDDIIDTGGTLCSAMDEIKTAGAVEIYALITHGLLNKNAVNTVNNSALTELVVTNSMDLKRKLPICPKLRVIDVTEVLANVIANEYRGESIGDMFDIERIDELYRHSITWYVRHSRSTHDLQKLRKN